MESLLRMCTTSHRHVGPSTAPPYPADPPPGPHLSAVSRPSPPPPPAAGRSLHPPTHSLRPRPPKSAEQYVPRVFGFKLHPTAYGNRETAPPRAPAVQQSSQRRLAAPDGVPAEDGQQKPAGQDDDSL